MAQRTVYPDFESFRHRPGAATIIRLMMAVNDLTIANQMMGEWRECCPPERNFRQVGAAQYFLRLQIAHLSEGLQIVEGMGGKNHPLRPLIDSADQETLASLRALREGKMRQVVKKHAADVRNKITFHYCSKDEALIEWAMKDRSTRTDAASRFSAVTRGNHSHLWYFETADKVLQSILVRKILDVPRSAEEQTEIDHKIMKIHEHTLKFLDFAGEIIWRFVTAP